MSKQGILCMFGYSDVHQFVLSNVFTFGVPFCGVLHDFHIKAIFDTSSCVCRRAHVLFSLSVFICQFYFDIWILIIPLVSSNSSLDGLRLTSCVPNVVSFSGLSIIDCPFLERLIKLTNSNIQ